LNQYRLNTILREAADKFDSGLRSVRTGADIQLGNRREGSTPEQMLPR
jgi:hypothetical protein